MKDIAQRPTLDEAHFAPWETNAGFPCTSFSFLWYTIVLELCHFFSMPIFPPFCVFDPHQVNIKPLSHLVYVSTGFQITTVYSLGSVSHGVFFIAWHLIVGSSENKEHSLQRNLNVDHLSDFCL